MTFLEWFWTLILFTSVAWYGLLLFLVGIKGGADILEMMKSLSEKHREENTKTDPAP